LIAAVIPPVSLITAIISAATLLSFP
jgi:hypothetical protein